MSKHFPDSAITRIIDANVNRAKEGLRVCEEITRFALDNRVFTRALKDIRHAIDSEVRHLPAIGSRMAARNSKLDIGREIIGNELKRTSLRDIFFANMQRAKESTRVLEEFSKLTNSRAALKIKQLRYKLYTLEQQIASKIK